MGIKLLHYDEIQECTPEDFANISKIGENNVCSRINNWRLDRMLCRSYINVYAPDK